MKHPIYRPIAIGALLALASLGARATDTRSLPSKPEAPVAGAITKISHLDRADVMLAA